MVEYQQALHAIRDIFIRFPEVKKLIKLELTQTESPEYVEFSKSKTIPEPQNHGTVSSNSTEPTGSVSYESGSGNVSNRSTSNLQPTEAIEPQTIICEHNWIEASNTSEIQALYTCTKCGLTK